MTSKKLIGLLGIIAAGTLWVQAQATRKAPVQKNRIHYNIQLGKAPADFTFVSVRQFDSIIGLPLHLRDSTGNIYEATAFEVIYSEWGLFEDSTGRERIMTEYYNMNVLGSKMPGYFQKQLTGMAKVGDTLTFQNVWAEKKDATGTKTIVNEASSKKYIINSR